MGSISKGKHHEESDGDTAIFRPARYEPQDLDDVEYFDGLDPTEGSYCYRYD